ncbi:MAG: L-lysine 6-transaminase [Phycisphaerae bacterium]|jgi:L-lysine 6-transaminase|nr:MAG: L-lysine 6-transaminase [Phycisphaerae bacterium]
MSEPYPQSAALIAELQRYVVVDPQPFVLDLSKGHGSFLVTIEGEEILDFGGYYGSKLIAHNHPGLNEPDYVRRLVAAANNKVPNPDFLTPECLEYYRLLMQLAPRCMRQSPTLEIYAVNSGAEAVENMMKYLINLYDRRRLKRSDSGIKRFIYFDNAFHGRTIAALNVTQLSHDPIITEDFRGLVAGNLQVPFPWTDADAPEQENQHRLEQSLSAIRSCLETYGNEVVGIIVEPIQSAGGHRVASASFFRQLSELAHQFGVYLAFDEVQTAGGQLGDVFAVDQLDLPYPPQALAVGKKFANGVVYMLETMSDRGVLDSTWGGSLADMVRFCQEWKIVRSEQLIEKVAPKTRHLLHGLSVLQSRYPNLLHNVRGRGLYQGFSLRGEGRIRRLVDIALDQEKLFLLPAGPQSIRLRPSLSVTQREIDLFLEKLDRCLEKISLE